MTIRWTGPFNGSELPVGQRIAGWSEGTTGGGTLKNRYRDGDPAAAVLWAEMYGNLNYQYAQSRRTLYTDTYVPKATGSADPSKVNTNTSWSSLVAIYLVTPPLILLPNVRRGDMAPPRLNVKVSARRDGGATNCTVRVYTAASLAEGVDGWERWSVNAPASAFTSFTISSNSYPADPGWSAEGTITSPAFSWSTYAFPVAADLRDMMVMETVLIVAAIGSGAGNGPRIRAVQVREEAPGG